MKTKRIYLDLETGGADPLLHSILELSVRDKDNNNTQSIIIKPQDNKCVEQEALDYNGIDIEKNIKEGKNLRLALDVLDFDFLGAGMPHLVYLIGWRVRFDFEFIKQAFKEAGKTLPPIVLIDLKKLAENKFKDFFKKEPYVTQNILYTVLFNEKPYEREDKSLTDIDMSQRIDMTLEEM